MGLKKYTSLVFVAIILLTMVTIPNMVSGQSSDDPHFNVDVENAAIFHGAPGEWDGTFTDPGTVVVHDGKFHMFRNGFQGWPASVEIGYLTSDDGTTWTEVTPDPVFYTADAPFSVRAALASSALVEDDGTWVLYFYLWPRAFGSSVHLGAIARATAPAPQGPWTMDTELSLSRGSAGEWDDGQLVAPSVIKTDEGYVMYYSGWGANTASNGIGMATSSDGITWTKYNDPATTEAPYAESDPVFLPSTEAGAWDSERVAQPRVRLTPDGYVMLYRSSKGADRDKAYGLAISQDGLHWERVGSSPVFSDAETNLRGIWYAELEYHNGTYYGYFEIQRGSVFQTDIYVGTWTGSLN